MTFRKESPSPVHTSEILPKSLLHSANVCVRMLISGTPSVNIDLKKNTFLSTCWEMFEKTPLDRNSSGGDSERVFYIARSEDQELWLYAVSHLTVAQLCPV